MNGNDRRDKIIQILKESKDPVSGRSLAGTFGVSRQVIVQDIAILRAADHRIASTNLGYVLFEQPSISRVFKVVHSDEETAEEMNVIVDYGGTMVDVFIYHKMYGIVKGNMNVRSRRDVEEFCQDIAAGRSDFLKNVTHGYHYHTVTAPSEKILDLIQEELRQKGFLAPLQEYEPIDFWGHKGDERN